jgi:hypothetical protein
MKEPILEIKQTDERSVAFVRIQDITKVYDKGDGLTVVGGQNWSWITHTPAADIMEVRPMLAPTHTTSDAQQVTCSRQPAPWRGNRNDNAAARAGNRPAV